MFWKSIVVSDYGIVAKTLEVCIELARAVTDISYNHPEGIKAAGAIASSIFLLRQGFKNSNLMKHIQKHYYPLDITLDEIQPTYSFNERAQDSTTQVIIAFLESNSFEDSIRNAVSLGGDANTIAAMTGPRADKFYGIPKNLLA